MFVLNSRQEVMENDTEEKAQETEARIGKDLIAPQKNGKENCWFTHTHSQPQIQEEQPVPSSLFPPSTSLASQGLSLLLACFSLRLGPLPSKQMVMALCLAQVTLVRSSGILGA